jgi:L-amino acid N-acyltransferase YncA
MLAAPAQHVAASGRLGELGEWAGTVEVSQLRALEPRTCLDTSPHMSIHIDRLTYEHWPEVSDIYTEGIATGHATFESEAPDWDHFAASHLPDQRHVAVEGGRVLGWVAATAVSDRCAYAGVAEHSVYVAEQARGQGIGLKLLEALIKSAETAGIWTIQSGIFPENHASLRLHERAGFRVVGTRQRIGRMAYGPLAGVWRDVIMIERRSPIAEI